MKKLSAKKLHLGKIRIASLSQSKQATLKGGMAQESGDTCISRAIACLSQGAGNACSWDICRF